MTNKQRYQRAFGTLHASHEFLMEARNMNNQKRHSHRRMLSLCAAVILLLVMAVVCYAEDVGGIQRKIQLWIHGDQTDAVIEIENGSYTLTYEDAEGVHERGGGGVAYDFFGRERPLTEEEILEHLAMPEVEYLADGTVWVYYRDQGLEITDLFDENGICFVQLKSGGETQYLTIKWKNGYASSPNGFVQPETFN